MTWQTKKLGGVCRINPSKKEITDLNKNLTVTFVPMSSVDEVDGQITDPEMKTLENSRKGYTYFKDGDVLFAKITPCMENGKAAIAKGLINGLGFGSTEFHVIRPGKDILPEWIFLYVRRKSFRKEAEKRMTGTAGQQRVPKNYLENVKIPLPPLKEQKRIVEKLEGVLGKIKEAQTLRQEAVEETEQLMPSALNKIIKEGSWPLWSLNDVATVISGFGFPKEYQGKSDLDYPFIKVSDMNLPGNEEYISSSVHTADSEILEKVGAKVYPPGTTIFPKIGGAVATNKKRMLEVEATFDNNVMGVIPGKTLDPKWIYYFFESIDLMELVKTTSVPSIRKSVVEDLEIPLPPIPKQRRIVEYLDGLQEKVTQLQALQSQTREDMEELEQSVLAKAFSGDLI